MTMQEHHPKQVAYIFYEDHQPAEVLSLKYFSNPLTHKDNVTVRTK